MSKQSQIEVTIAHDSFISIKKQLCTDEKNTILYHGGLDVYEHCRL